MNNLQNILREITLLVTVILCQWLIMPWFALYETAPDLLLIYLLLRSLHLEKPAIAVIGGFLGGFTFDWLTGGFTGLSSLTLLLAGFCGALTGRENEKLTKTSLLILGFCVITFCSGLQLFIRLAGLPAEQILISHLLPLIFYNLTIYLVYINLFSFKKKRKMI